ncbi:putative ribonuclease H-like domain-containing protein [Tanacetum coccineum]
MLADSLLPIPFWAEAVNTACYVLNRVLVTKPQNKTPYELLIDSLGKFDGKSDEGYLLGYSTFSKAFRVYNKRTKSVEENLHINFLKDQPNVAGTGPNWMFDLDFLTNTMNYIPVSVENQVNVDAGTQDSYVAGSSGKYKGPTQEYILLPLQPHRTRIPVKDVVQIAQEKPSENASSNKDDVSRQAFEEENRRIASQKKAAQATNANFNNMDNTIAVSPIPTLRIHKDHPKGQILGDPTSNSSNKRINFNRASFSTTSLEEVYAHQPPGFVESCSSKQSLFGKSKLLYGYTSALRRLYETLSSFLMENGFRREFEECMHKRFQMSSMGKLTFFLGLQVKQLLEGIFISQDKYVADILKKFDFLSIRTATTPIESNKPLVKDEDGVDVHIYRSMIGSLIVVRLNQARHHVMLFVTVLDFQVPTQKAFTLNAVKRIFRIQIRDGYTFQFHDTSNTIVMRHFKCYSRFVAHSKDQAIGDSLQFFKRLLYEENNRRLSRFILFHNVQTILTKGFDDKHDLRMDRSWAANSFYSWSKPNESVGFTEVVDFLKGTSLRYALTHNPTIYDSLVKQFWQTATVRTLANRTQQLVASINSIEYTITEASVRSKLQLADATGIHNLSDAEIYVRLATLGYVTEGDFVPLLPTMLARATVDQGEGSAQPAEPYHTPVDPISSTSQPPIPITTPSSITTLSSHSYITTPHPSPPPHSPPYSPPHSPHQSPPFSPPHYSPPRSYEAPLPEGNTSGSAEDSMQLKELMDIVPRLVTRIETLETELQQTKTTYGKAVAHIGEEPEDQGRIIQDIDDDPLVSLVRESMKMNEKSTDFVTPTKASGEAQEEDISPTILEAAKTLSKVASQGVSKVKSTDKGKRYRRRARSVAKNINTGLDAEEEINTGIEEVSTGSAKVDSGTTSKRCQREGKAPIVEEYIQATHKTKEQIRQEEAGLEEAIKLQAQMDEEVAKQIHLDEMIAKRMAEEEALSK